MPTDNLPKCVVMVDAENIPLSSLRALMHWLRGHFKVVKAIGFGDFTQQALRGAEEQLRRWEITPRHVPCQHAGRLYRKNMVDSTLIVEMMTIYAQHRHDLDNFVLVSGDGHFEPMVRALSADNKSVIVAAPRSSLNRSLGRSASRLFELKAPAYKAASPRTP
jgi:uncharacterized LabA/DUF88 family protein